MKNLKIFIVATALISANAAMASPISECAFKKPETLEEGKGVMEQLKRDCLPKIAKVQNCVSRARMMLEGSRDLAHLFISDDQDKTLMVDAAVKGPFEHASVNKSVWKNFQSLQVDYNKALDEIDQFADRYRSKTDSTVKIKDFLAELDQGYTGNINILRSLSEKESALLTYLDLALSDLTTASEQNRNEVLWLRSEECRDAEIKGIVDLSEAALVEMVNKIDLIHRQIVRARQAREHLMEYVYKAIRYDLETKYHDQLSGELAALGGKLQVIIQVDRLSTLFELWLTSIGKDEDHNMIGPIYLQFEASRMLAINDYMTAKEYKENILKASEQFPEVGAAFLNRINPIVDGMEKKISDIETRGWEGLLKSQVLLSQRRVSLANRYSQACIDASSAYLAAADLVTTLEAFRPVEQKYMEAVKLCRVNS